MRIEDEGYALETLARRNYYRLSGYWYPMRELRGGSQRGDNFVDGASFDLTVKLYEFDEELRHSIFQEIAPVELAVRALLGYELGSVDPCAHLKIAKLGAGARKATKGKLDLVHDHWLERYREALRNFQREDFVKHHQNKYGGEMPIWVAVEVMDWGMLSYLYKMSPNHVRNRIASRCALSAPQMESWLKSLNVLRNLAAHHARMFNRVYTIKPKLNQDPRLMPVANCLNRIFGQMTMIQYLHRQLGLSSANRLPEVLETYPSNNIVPFSRTGAPEGWRYLDLWKH